MRDYTDVATRVLQRGKQERQRLKQRNRILVTSTLGMVATIALAFALWDRPVSPPVQMEESTILEATAPQETDVPAVEPQPVPNTPEEHNEPFQQTGEPTPAIKEDAPAKQDVSYEPGETSYSVNPASVPEETLTSEQERAVEAQDTQNSSFAYPFHNGDVLYSTGLQEDLKREDAHFIDVFCVLYKDGIKVQDKEQLEEELSRLSNNCLTGGQVCTTNLGNGLSYHGVSSVAFPDLPLSDSLAYYWVLLEEVQ